MERSETTVKALASHDALEPMPPRRQTRSAYQGRAGTDVWSPSRLVHHGSSSTGRRA